MTASQDELKLTDIPKDHPAYELGMAMGRFERMAQIAGRDLYLQLLYDIVHLAKYEIRRVEKATSRR